MMVNQELRLHERIAQESSQQEWTRGIIGYFYQMYARRSRDFLDSNNTRQGLVLDLGCGEGLIFEDSHRQHRIVQLDASETVLRAASAHNNKVVCGNAMELPFKDKSFNLIFLVAILEHTSQPARIIREVWRVAKEKARVFVVIPNDISLSIGRLFLLKFPLRNPGHLSFLTPCRLRKMTEGTFEVLEGYNLPFKGMAFFFNMYYLTILEKR